MKTSDSILKIAPALLAAKKAFKPALKTAENPHFKSKYVDLQSVVDATEDALAANGLLLIQTPGTIHEALGPFACVTTRLIHVSGEWIEDTLTLPSGTVNRFDAQTVGSAITYARRYSYMGILGIAPEDDDGSTASGSHSVSKPAFVQYQRPVTPIKTLPQADAESRGDSYEPDPLFDDDGNIVESQSTVQHREQKQAERADDSVPSVIPASGRRVTVPMAKRFIAIAKNAGKSWEQINAAFKAIGIAKAEELPSDQYEVFVNWAGGSNERRA